MKNPQEPPNAAGGHLDDEGVSECAFSPEQAAPGALEHATGCADCSARIEELTRLLSSLADLPEPEIPDSVLIRLDATIEQAWQEADAEAARKPTVERRRRARGWLPLAVPAAALGVIIAFVLGVSAVIHIGGSSASTSAGSSANAAAGTAEVPGPRPMNATQLTQMVSAALTAAGIENGPHSASGAGATDGVVIPHSAASPASPAAIPMAACFVAPQRAGYTVTAVAAETYSGRDASLVVYRNDKEPASTTTFYAVLYAGSCPNSASQVLDEGFVSVSR